MILSDSGIRQALKKHEITIDPPPDDDQYTTSAVDLLLGGIFQAWSKKMSITGQKVELDLSSTKFLDIAAAHLVDVAVSTVNEVEVTPLADGGVILGPKQFLLGVTREEISLHQTARLAARVEGRSSLARLGLMVHLTAPIIHAGYHGHITLEMINHGPFHLKLVPDKIRICQLVFERLETSPRRLITGQFVGHTKPSGRR